MLDAATALVDVVSPPTFPIRTAPASGATFACDSILSAVPAPLMTTVASVEESQHSEENSDRRRDRCVTMFAEPHAGQRRMEGCARGELNCHTHHLRQLALEPRPSPRPSRVLRSQGFTKHVADEALEPKWIRILVITFLQTCCQYRSRRAESLQYCGFSSSVYSILVTYGLLSKNKITNTPQLSCISQHSHCSLVTIHCRLFCRAVPQRAGA